MARLKLFFLNKFRKISETIQRFYLSFGLIIALFLVSCSITLGNFDEATFKILFKLIYTFIFGIFTCILAKVFHEKYFKNKLDKFILDVISVVISATSYVFLHFCVNNTIILVALTGIVFSEIIFILYFSKTDSISETFDYFFKNIIFSFFACVITFIGISVCILAFTNLIYNFKNSYKAYFTLAEFVGIILLGMLLLLGIPRIGQKIAIPKVFKIIVARFMLPIYILLLSILYIYLGKILFTWTFPSGQVNWFVSFSSLLFIFFSFSLHQYKNENKVIYLFLKLGGLVILPTIVMQFVAIYIRVSSYGLTSIRYASIILNIFAAVFAIVSLIFEEKGLKHLLTILSVFILTVTTTPLNVIDIPMRNQSNRLRILLLNNGMLVNNDIIQNKSPDLEEKNRIIESYRYIKNNFKIANYKPDFLNENLIKKQDNEVFGFESTYTYTRSSYYSDVYFYYDYNFIDIGNYSRFYNVLGKDLNIENDEIVLNYENKKQIINGFYNHLKDLYLKYKKLGENNVNTEKIEYEFGNNKLILSSVRVNQDENEVFKIDFHGNCYLLER